MGCGCKIEYPYCTWNYFLHNPPQKMAPNSVWFRVEYAGCIQGTVSEALYWKSAFFVTFKLRIQKKIFLSTIACILPTSKAKDAFTKRKHNLWNECICFHMFFTVWFLLLKKYSNRDFFWETCCLLPCCCDLLRDTWWWMLWPSVQKHGC